MFNFDNQTTNEYKSFAKYVNPETNKPYSSEYVKNNVTQLEYGYSPKFDKTLFYTLEEEAFLSNEECSYLINLSQSQNKWLSEGQTLPFWVDRNTSLFNIVFSSDNKEYTKQLVLKIHDELKVLFKNKFACDQEIFCDQIGIVRWPVGSWQMPHIDQVPHINRVCGSVIYLNDDYAGGETFYPFFDEMMKPRKGKMFAHTPDNEHFHGVTKISKCTRYTISSTWSTTTEVQPYKEMLSKLR